MTTTTEVTRPWHQVPSKHVLEALESSPQGLGTAEAQRRLVEYGPNVLL